MGNARIINPKPRETQIQNDKPTDHRQQELQSKSAALEIKGKGNGWHEGKRRKTSVRSQSRLEEDKPAHDTASRHAAT